MSKIFKAQNNNTCLAEDAPGPGWVEITRAEYEAILGSRAVSPPTPTIDDDIHAKLRELGLAQEWMLHSHMAGALAYAASLGLTEPQAYATNPAYRKAKDTAAWIAARRAQG